MKTVGKVSAWVCILSSLLMGCYSSMLIDPTTIEQKFPDLDHIDYVVTKDGTRYVFDKPPAVVDGKIVGEIDSPNEEGFVRKQPLSIPISDLAEVRGSKFNSQGTAVLSVGIGVTALVAGIIAGMSSWHLWSK